MVVEPLELHERGGLADLRRAVDERRHAVVERGLARPEDRLLHLGVDDADVLLLHLLQLDRLERLDGLDDARPARHLAVLVDAVAAAEHLVEGVLVVHAHLGREVTLAQVVLLGVGVEPIYLLAVLLAELAACDGLAYRHAHLVRGHQNAARVRDGVFVWGCFFLHGFLLVGLDKITLR